VKVKVVITQDSLVVKNFSNFTELQNEELLNKV